VHPVELAASLDDSPASAELAQLLDEIAACSPLLTVVRRDDDPRRPSFAIVRVGTDVSVRFAGMPLGHEFTSLVLALLQVGGHPSKAIDDELAERIRALPGGRSVRDLLLASRARTAPTWCRGSTLMSMLNPEFRVTTHRRRQLPGRGRGPQGAGGPVRVRRRRAVRAGRMTLEEIVDRLDEGAADRAAEQLAAKDDFDVLVVGGGPAGASAAIYAARKGIATGIVSERFGGQVLDTMAIENLISVPHTEGPKLAAALEEHVREYEVDIMDRQKAARLVPAAEPGGLIGVELENGAVLRSRTVVLATGARWRSMNVPGEAEYRNKGVTYCPHCDGPLFKGKRVAVIGGGNSGVEAAIDLAGVVRHVTLLEFDSKLRADEVLQAQAAQPPQRRHHRERDDHRGAGRRRRSPASCTRIAPPTTCTASTSRASSCRSASCPTPSGWPTRWRSRSGARS
jgi:alkyl hydroperoxide reductase subunit F